MGRRVKRFLVVGPTAAAVLILGLLLATCSNEFDIYEAIRTDMKIANDLFLEITDSSPEKNVKVSQLERIEIEFDRSIDTNTVDESSIIFDPAPGIDPDGMQDWSFIYNNITRTLYIYPNPFLNAVAEPDVVQYTVTVNHNLKGADGSDLQNPYSWSFETEESPTGNFLIEALYDDPDFQNGDTEDLYTDSANVKLYVYGTNTRTRQMKYAETEEEITAPTWDGWVDLSEWYPPATLDTITLPDPSIEGTKTLYMGFADNPGTLPGANQLKADTIILDLYPPSVNVGANRVVNYYSSTPVWLDATVSDSASGIASCLWTKTSGTGTVTFGTPTKEDTTVSVGTDGTYVLNLKAEDKVGREKSDSLSVLWDTTRPSPPAFVITGVTPTVTVDRTIQWDWTSGGGGNGTFLRSLNGAAWTAVTPPFNYTAKSDGSYTLRVTELDNAGNNNQDPRLHASRTILITPVIPPNGATGVSLTTDLDWRDYTGLNITYDVYLRAGTIGHYTQVGAGLTSSELLNPGTLSGFTTFNWYFVAKAKGTVAYTSPVFSFTTGK